MNNQFDMNNGFNMSVNYNNENEENNLDESLYTDGIDKKPKLVIIIGGIVLLLIIVLISFFACGNRKKSANNNLTSITITGGTFTPEFNKSIISYDILTEKEIVTINCAAESKKASTKGCNERVILNNSCVEHEVIVTAEDKTSKTYILNICNQSKNAPIVKNVKISPEKYTSGNVTITVEAEAAEQTILHDEPYSFDDGMTWQKDNKYVVKSNSSITIKVRDSKGVESGSNIKEINNIDRAKPKVSLNGSIPSGESTTSNVDISAEVTPSTTPSGYTYQWYKNDSKISKATSQSYNATSSGTYKVVVKTGAGISVTSPNYKVVKKSTGGGGTSYTVSINKVSGNPTSWTKDDITLTVSASASNGLNSKAYSFDEGKTWQSSNSKSFSSNQKVKIIVRDSKGNKSSTSTQTINKIDKTIPTTTILGTTNIGSVLTAKVSPSTTPSGYTYQWYKDNNIVNGATSQAYTAYAAGTYSVKVTTGAGNTKLSSSKTVTIPVSPSVVLTGDIPSGQKTYSPVKLMITVKNGTGSKYTWYKDNKLLNCNSTVCNTKLSGTYKVQVVTTTGQTIISNTYVVNFVIINPTISIDARKGSYTGPVYTSDTWSNKDVYITVNVSATSSVNNVYFQHLSNKVWYYSPTQAWRSLTINDKTAQGKIYFTADRNYAFNVMAVDEDGGKTIKGIVLKIDKTLPKTPVLPGFDCYTNFSEITTGSSVELGVTSAAKLVTTAQQKPVLCIGNSNSSYPSFTDYSGISKCEFRYPTNKSCNYLKESWSSSSSKTPSMSSASCNSPINFLFGMRCYDGAGNVSKPLYVISYET